MFFIIQNSKWIINEEDMGLELEMGLMLFFKQTILHPFLVFFELLLYF
jgi:hypothetical protein